MQMFHRNILFDYEQFHVNTHAAQQFRNTNNPEPVFSFVTSVDEDNTEVSADSVILPGI
jgi:hypothetical protein